MSSRSPLGQVEGMPEMDATLVGLFEVDDTDAAVARVRDNGGEVVVSAQDCRYGWMAVVEGCCGATFSLLHGQTG
jgi:predicted enzyme related to lactoylglutathione lyase